MKRETRRRLRNILHILKGEIGTEIWPTGYYRVIIWGSVNDVRPKKARYGHVRLL